jgi:hypothetical protein
MPTLSVMRSGTLVAQARKSSSRLFTSRTGEPVASASMAASRLLASSIILPPKPPPVVDWITRMREAGICSTAARRARTRNADWVDVHTCSRPSGSMAATDAIGSM